MLLVYDGDCGFCTSSARWVEARTSRAVLTVAPWQALDLDEIGLTEHDVTTAAWLVDGDDRQRGAEAVATSLVTVGGGWGLLGRSLRLPPISWLARAGYALVARYRHRLPGATDACRLDA